MVINGNMLNKNIMKNNKYRWGDILAFRPSGIKGELIVAIDSKGFGQYSHNAIFWKYEKGVPLFIESHESNRRGVTINKLQEHWQNFDVFRPVGLKPRPVQDVLETLGNGYNTGRLIKVLLLRIFGITIDKTDDVSETICTEHVNFVYKYKLLKAGYETPYEIEKLYLEGKLTKINV